MRCYHRTSTEAAAAILAEGFRDAEGYYMTGNLYRGVWVSAEPLNESEGATGDALLSTAVPEDVFAEYEWVEDGKPYREALIPADVLNGHGPLTVVDDEEDR
jgi:hypothetical protein